MNTTNINNTVMHAVPNLPLYDGLLNVSSCKYNSASYVSFPHFYLADPALLEQFDPRSDLEPRPALHSSHLTLMPRQGIPLEVTASCSPTKY